MNSFYPNSHPLDFLIFDLFLWERYFTYHFITCMIPYTCRSRINWHHKTRGLSPLINRRGGFNRVVTRASSHKGRL